MQRRILIVDDDRQMVRTLCDILRLRGWEAQGAHSGEEAVAAVKREQYTTVLMDVRMGGMSGVDALKMMKAERPALRVVLMTAYTANDLLAEATRQGALKILSKPVAVPGLIEMLEESVEQTHRVLVVDDDPAYLKTLTAILRDGGYVVFEARDLDDALGKIKGREPAAVVLDLRLPHGGAPDSGGGLQEGDAAEGRGGEVGEDPGESQERITIDVSEEIPHVFGLGPYPVHAGVDLQMNSAHHRGRLPQGVDHFLAVDGGGQTPMEELNRVGWIGLWVDENRCLDPGLA